MARYAKRKRTRYVRRKYKRRYTFHKRGKAYAMYKSLSRRIAGEVNKFETSPLDFGSQVISQTSTTTTFGLATRPLTTISSGVPYIFPINWVYTPVIDRGSQYVHQGYLVDINNSSVVGGFQQFKQPAYYKIIHHDDSSSDVANRVSVSTEGSQLQYRLAYIYINAILRASNTDTANSTTSGCVRFVIVKDKSPVDQGATWFNAADNKRSVFNNNTINAQLNQQSLGRFKVLYDKKKFFSTIQPYKIFKFFKRLSQKVRNSQPIVSSPEITAQNRIMGVVVGQDGLVPVQTAAYYLMIFSDGLTFQYTTDSATSAGSFTLFNRLAYYNN